MAQPWWVLQAGRGLDALWYTFQGTRAQATQYVREGGSGEVVKGPFSSDAAATRWLNANATPAPGTEEGGSPSTGGGGNGKYTYAQLEGLWIQAGGPRALAPIAAAIALAESGGNPRALNPDDNNGTQSSYGLWQISNGTHSPPAANWSNPHENATLAVQKWHEAGDSFSPWGTYDSGAYKGFLSNKTTPESVPGSSSAGSSGGGSASSGPDCLVKLPTLLGGGCAFRVSEARALIGGAFIGVGGLVGLVGVVVLLAAALQKSGAAGKIADAAAVVPGGQVVAAAASRVQQAPQRAQQRARQPRKKAKDDKGSS